MKRIQEEAATQHQQNEEKLKNAQEKVAQLEKQLETANKVCLKFHLNKRNLL